MRAWESAFRHSSPPPFASLFGRIAARHAVRLFPCLALAAGFLESWSPPALGQSTSYWDSNGTTTGAGAAPTGTWGVDNFWNSDPTGGGNGTFQIGTLITSDVFFSAGSDAVDPYTVGLNSATQSARLVTFKDGTATLNNGTLSLGNLGGITVTTGTVTGATINSNLTVSGSQSFNVAASRTLTLNTGTFTRNAGATLNVASTGTVTTTMTGLDSASLVNGIIGPWASYGSGASTRYATIDGSNTILGLTGTAAATAANVTSVAGTFNYDMAGGNAVFGTNANINTLRYTGGGATITGNLTTRGIMNVGGGALTLSGTVNGGGELVVNTANGNVQFNAVLTSGTTSLVKDGPGRLTTTSAATTFTGPVTVNGGVLQYGDQLAWLTSGNITLNGGVIEQRWTATNTLAQGTGAGQIQVLGGESGFSENGNTGLTWNIGAVTWGSATFNPSKFVLQTSASQGTSSLTFASAINLNGSDRTIIANAGASGTATSTLSGAITNSTGTAGLIKEGPGQLILSGTNTYNGNTTVSTGVLTATTTGALPGFATVGRVIVADGATIGVRTGAWTSANIDSLRGAATWTSANSGLGLDTTAASFTYASNITEPISVLKLNGNNLTLSGASTYTGRTRTNGGGIVVATIGNIGLTSGPLGTNNTAIDFIGSAGELEYTGAGETSNRLIDITGTAGTIRTSSNTGALVLSAAVAPTGTGTKTLTLLGTSTLNNTVSGSISNGAGGTLAITKNLAGTWILSGTNTYSGSTTISGGTLVLAGSGALPSGSQLVWGTTGTTLRFENDSNRSVANTLNTSVRSTTRTLVVDRLTSGAAVNLLFSSGPSLDCGTVLNFQAGGDIISGTPIITFAGGTGSSDSNNGTIAGGTGANGAIRFNPTGVDVVINGITSTSRTRGYILDGTSVGNRITGTWGNGSGTEVLKTGAGTWTLAGTSQYTLSTTISGGTLKFERQTALYNNTPASWTAANIRVNSGGTLAFNVGGTNEFTTGSITTLLTNLAASSSATNGMNAGSFFGFDTTNASGGNFTVADVLADSTGASGGARGLTKLGNGTLALSASNTYSGPTTIAQGTLSVTAGDINASSGIGVAAGALLAYNSSTPLTALTSLNGTGTGPSQRAVLGGTGTISLALSLDNTGDVLSPGNSPGIMSFTTGQTWSSFGYDWELNDWAASVAGTNVDQIQITGGLSLTGATAGSYVVDVLSLTADNVAGNVTNFADATNSWTILTTTAGITGFDPARWTVDSSGFTSTPTATGTWNVGLSNDSQNLVLNYVAVPEPSTLVLAAAGLVALGWRLRRRA
jgi:autotransporter-associated beta strand protein